jgi:hypothetical protein
MRTLKDLKVGDNVWTIYGGKTKVEAINFKSTYPIQIESGSTFMLDGKRYVLHHHPSLFLENPFKTKSLFNERWVLVSDSNIYWCKRWLVKETNKEYSYVVYSGAATEYELTKVKGEVISYKFMKEIEEVKIIELTLEDIAKKYNVDVSEIRIKE